MRVVIHDIVDALELFLLHHLLLPDVINLKPAHLGIVRGVDNPLALTVERHESRIVELDTIDVLQLPLLARSQVNLSEVGKVARRIHSGIGLTRDRVVDQRRHGAQRLTGERSGRCNRILSYGGKILLLMLPLILFPLLPCFPQRFAIDLLELTTEESTAVGSPVVEADHLVVAIGLGEVVHEAGTIEIGVSTHLEVHRGAFRLKPHHREELFVAVDDAAEVHLVVSTKSPAHTSAKPGLHKAGDTLVIPTGRIPARNTHEAPYC